MPGGPRKGSRCRRRRRRRGWRVCCSARANAGPRGHGRGAFVAQVVLPGQVRMRKGKKKGTAAPSPARASTPEKTRGYMAKEGVRRRPIFQLRPDTVAPNSILAPSMSDASRRHELAQTTTGSPCRHGRQPPGSGVPSRPNSCRGGREGAGVLRIRPCPNDGGAATAALQLEDKEG